MPQEKGVIFLVHYIYESVQNKTTSLKMANFSSEFTSLKSDMVPEDLDRFIEFSS